ncbi:MULTISPECIES: DUF5926 family protein [unclassified Schaalia]|uniref:DUF5926 family protein n=1 Tax=unclassified Schaalia TaxID=2691889 RepID=UPI001E43745E|nr:MULTISPECIES: DUF5926 family protein [unclassified Schaalia]MCD4550131.1 DUF5926 family protein [Schaalia sp. lx-260]MCD4557802.1 DUF5926 family protein [Schaalia sp. lx-100]
MGKASRRKKVIPSAQRPAPRAPIPFVERPYEGLAVEKELVAMREIIPCATMTARTTSEYGSVEFDIVTLLPEGFPAMIRADGRILIGLQTRNNSGDLSHDAGAALVAALAAREQGAEGTVAADIREPAPRLQELVDNSGFGPMELTADYGYWFDPSAQLDADTQRALERNREEVIPTEAVPGVEGMYWCAMNRHFVRILTDIDESRLFTALARLQLAGRTRLGEGSRFVGAFRACGIAIPVFELGDGVTAADIAADAKVFAQALTETVENTDPLTHDERRVRQGLISRQVTIR